MKTIIAATDFSIAAHNASLYAVALAKAFDARLLLFHAYHTPLVPVTEELPVITPADMEEVVQLSLREEIKRIDPSVEVVVRADAKEAAPVEGIVGAVREHQADLLITGMKKSGTAVRKVLGSTVTGLIGRSPVPMLIVPEQAAFEQVRTIVLAYEGDLAPDDDVQVLDAVRQLAQRFGSTVYLVHVARTAFREIYQLMHKPDRLMRIMNKLDPVFETLRSKSVSEALDHFIVEHRADMLALLPEKKNQLQRWFTGSTTRHLTYKAKVPLLVLPGYHAGGSQWWSKAIAGKISSIAPSKN